MITTMERGIIDLNLNCSPWESTVSINDEIRQVMIGHETIFREQLTELHKLYWTQKNLMHDLYLQNSYHKSIPVSSSSHEYQIPFQWNRMNWARNDFEIGESSGYGTGIKGKNVRNFIDLEKTPINLDSDEEDEEEVICLPELHTNETERNKIGKFGVDSCCASYNLNSNPSSEYSTQLIEPKHEPIYLDPSTTASRKLLQIDLNVTEDEEDPTHYQPDPLTQSDSLNGSFSGSSKENIVINLNTTPSEEVEVDTISSEVIIITGDDDDATLAAETLLSIQSKRLEQMEISSDCASEDSFVMATLTLLEETLDDDAAWTSKIESDEAGNRNKINLRRGRGLRDFQRDVLPGLVSLSRTEICEDLHAIGFETRKNRSRRNSYKNEEWAPSGGTRRGTRKTRRKKR